MAKFSDYISEGVWAVILGRVFQGVTEARMDSAPEGRAGSQVDARNDWILHYFITLRALENSDT